MLKFPIIILEMEPSEFPLEQPNDNEKTDGFVTKSKKIVQQ